MEYISLLQTALVLFRAVLYTMAYICAGGALIALMLYVFLTCSEIFFSQSHSTARVKASQSARPVAEQSPDVSAAERLILPGPEHLEEELVGAPRVPISVAVTLKGDVN
jgi:hypothetical protein